MSRRARGLAVGTAAVVAPVMLLAGTPADASAPIPFAYTVCIKDGKLVSESDRHVSPREWHAPSSIGHYEGRTVRIEGPLSPGGFVARTVTVVAESCRPELLKSESLCNPCLTTLPEVLPVPPPEPPKQ